MRNEQCHADCHGGGDDEGDHGGNQCAHHNRGDVGEEAVAALDVLSRSGQGRDCLHHKEQRDSEEDRENQAPCGHGGPGENLVPGASCALGGCQGVGGHFTILQSQ
ncbi:hypothetical protein D3C73_1156540 [compost metagenome]